MDSEEEAHKEFYQVLQKAYHEEKSTIYNLIIFL